MTRQEKYTKGYLDETRQFFIEDNLHTVNATDGGKMPFTLFPRQIEFLKSLAYNKNTIAIKHRQAGITTVTSAWAVGQIVFCDKDAQETILCIGNKTDIAEQLLDKIVDFADQVPRWYWGKDYYHEDPNHPNNKRSIYVSRNKRFVEFFNGCRVYARSSGKHAARGIPAVSILILDEAAFIQDGVAVYAQAAAATSSVPHSRIIMVSTPHGKDQLYYNTYTKALSGENNFHPVEFKWYQDLRYNRHLRWSKVIDDELVYDTDPVIDEKGNIVYNEERWRRLDKDGWKPESPWYIDFCLQFNNDKQYIAQEVENSFLGSIDTVVDSEVIDYHRKNNVIELPEDWKLKDPYVRDTWIWKDPIPGHRYILACDNSTGSSEDNTCIEIIDLDNIDEETGLPYYEQVLEYSGKLRGDYIGEIVNQYGRMYNNALVVVEDIGGYGSATLIRLMELGYPNIYHDNPALKNFTSPTNINKINTRDELLRPGFHSSHLRLQIINNFVSLLTNNTFRVRSTRVINELETWIFRNGRPDHMKGAHDDTLMCLSMGMFVAVFYMLKKETLKERNVQMLKSWVSMSSGSQANRPFENQAVQKSKELNKVMWKCGIVKM